MRFSVVAAHGRADLEPARLGERAQRLARQRLGVGAAADDPDAADDDDDDDERRAATPAARSAHSERAAAREHGRHGLDEDAEVEEDRPALEVEEVQPHEVVEVQLRAAGDLPQAGDARA